MLDFNGADQQGSGTGGAIPPDSIVAFKMTIRQPKAEKQGTQHPLFCRASTGNEYIDVEFEAVGTFEGRKVWQNFTLYGSDKAAKISMATLRAIIESARNIDPKDPSPQAAEGRKISDWSDFNSMTFLAKVKCVVEKSNKDGQFYVNNELAKIITPGMPEYALGEQITDKPLPVVPDHDQPAGAAAGPAAGTNWGAPQGNAPGAGASSAASPGPVTAPSPSSQPQQQAGGPLPTWAQR